MAAWLEQQNRRTAGHKQGHGNGPKPGQRFFAWALWRAQSTPQ
jgi:hypothetical protein